MKPPFKNTIISVSLLLIVLFLFTKSPARAAAGNNPIFATIDVVQQMIATAFSPIQSSVQGLSNRVGNLEATVTPIPGQITNLQTTQNNQTSQITGLTNRVSALENTSTSGKQFVLYDANNQRLGILLDGAGLSAGGKVYTFYNEKLEKIISFNGIDIIPAIAANYTTNDCSGTAYVGEGYNNYLFSVAGGGGYAVVDTNTSPTSKLIRSYFDYGLATPGCSQINQIMNNLVPLIQVSYPYQNTIATPLDIKYQ